MIYFRVDNKGKGLVSMNLGWWTPTRKEWTPVLHSMHPQFWAKESDPSTGKPWARLRPNYKVYKESRYPGQPILKATGTMLDTMKIRSTKDKFLVDTTNYGPYQQFGTKRMVARPWVGVPQVSMEPLSTIALKNILSRKR